MSLLKSKRRIMNYLAFPEFTGFSAVYLAMESFNNEPSS